MHIQQSRPNTCQAACAAMALTANGIVTTEADLIARWGTTPQKGYPIDVLNREEQFRHQKIILDAGASISLLCSQLNNQIAVCIVFGGIMQRFYSNRNLNSKYGPLYQGGPLAFPLHAILLRTANNHTITFHDPYHAAPNQPLQMDMATFINAAQGTFYFI